MPTSFDWSQVSTAWETHRDQIHDVNEPVRVRLVEALGLRPGQRVLEVAAGNGELAVHLARLVQPGGRVIASDVAAGMVDLIRRAVEQHGGTGVDVRQLHACNTELPDDSMDAVVCQMGLMFIADPAEALREWRRVLVPAGVLAVAVWGAPQHNPWLAHVGMSAMMHGVFAGGPPTAPGGVFSLGDPEQLGRLVTDAGFAQVVVDEVPSPAHYGSTDEHFDTVTALAGPLAAAIRAANDESRATVRAAVAEADARFATPGELVLPGLALVVRARAA